MIVMGMINFFNKTRGSIKYILYYGDILYKTAITIHIE